MGWTPPDPSALWKRVKPVVRRFLIRVALALFLFWPLGMLFVGGAWRIPTTPEIAFSALFDREHSGPVWLDRMVLSNSLRRAVVANEDPGFCEHMGFYRYDPARVWSDFWTGRPIVDETGSPWYEVNRTLSRNAARQILLWGGPGDPLRAVLNVWYTILMEMTWSKDRIVNTYVNTVEWAPGVFGAEAAARFYYRMPASELDRAQAARLACLLTLRRDKIAVSGPDDVPERLVVDVLEGMKNVRIRNSRICP
ncbi:transglycosylase domain-containing protein [Phaeovibrio sulfidiphilus]|uniref:Transglycosylase domain-containing protein n=1 Tax=Phaeovibrio sulfidiphilus TaxID=1220600 RepID=A0A8J6YKV4_9PROT|nr:transglycosylase domain-containing protein [Phaeovibrio sulfidiphilus]MBE1236155.1 transglycosylase domain-containing protein [Phaeovibrio sulfidiphilus]